MEAKELMVSDLVVNTEFGRKQIGRIECIEPTRVWLQGGKSYTPISYILPIPLTTEILEKNGFVYKEDDRILTGGFYQFVGEGKREGYFILIKFYDGTIGDIKVLVKIHTESSYGIGVNEIHSCDIEYVHELQHALRLCGIEKTIEL